MGIFGAVDGWGAGQGRAKRPTSIKSVTHTLQ